MVARLDSLAIPGYCLDMTTTSTDTSAADLFTFAVTSQLEDLFLTGLANVPSSQPEGTDPLARGWCFDAHGWAFIGQRAF